MLTEKQLAEIERLERATSQGEWKLFHAGNTIEIQLAGERPIVAWSGFDDCLRPLSEHRANAKFIARARTIVPALLRDIRRLRAVVEQYADRRYWGSPNDMGYNYIWQIEESGYTRAAECLREDGE